MTPFLSGHAHVVTRSRSARRGAASRPSSTRGGRTLGLVVALGLVVGVLTPMAAGAAALTPVLLDSAQRPSAPDYATEVMSDPWDFANAQDILTDDNGPALNVAYPGAQPANGRLTLSGDAPEGCETTATRNRPCGTYVSPLFGIIPGALPENRSGLLYPLDADRYTNLAVRLKVNKRLPGGWTWFGCDDLTVNQDFAASCRGGKNFVMETGWHTYLLRLDLNRRPGEDLDWRGTMIGTRLAFGDFAPGQPARFDAEVDWIRVYQPGAGSGVTWERPTGAEELYWDRDADPGNNTPQSSDWGLVCETDADLTGDPDAVPCERTGAFTGPQTTTFRSDAYPPGTYRFFVGNASGTPLADYSEPLEIAGPPLPVIDDPDRAGGEDYITAATGDAWDFSQASDGTLVNGRVLSWDNGVLYAENCCGDPSNRNTPQGDPYVQLRLAQAGIDGDRYHRMTVKTTYEGDFDLHDDNRAGGGTHGRVIWERVDSGPGVFYDSREIVTYTDRDTYTFDLRTTPPFAVQEFDNYANDDSRARGWIGSTVTALRWDPNEDRGKRRWRLDDIQLRADDESTDAFDIEWHDDNTRAGDRVTIGVDTNDFGYDGVPIAEGLSQAPGSNQFRWVTRDLLPGTRWVYLQTTNDQVSNGQSAANTYASGPLVISPRLSGRDRIKTSIALSRNVHPDGAPAAVIALDRNFPDALASTPLADAVGGPILLNQPEALNGDVRDELIRLGAKRVFVMGGPAALSDAVVQGIRALPGVSEVTRIAGPDRYATAAAAADRAAEIWRQDDSRSQRNVLVALGTSFPDALAAGPLSVHARQPLLLVDPQQAPQATRDALARLGADRVTIVGGPAAVSDAVANSLGVPYDRIGGRSRYHTAQLIAEEAARRGGDIAKVVVARGDDFPDALAAGAAVAARGGVLVLADRQLLPEETRAFLAARAGNLSWLRVAGGAAALSRPVVDSVLAAANLR